MKTTEPTIPELTALLSKEYKLDCSNLAPYKIEKLGKWVLDFRSIKNESIQNFEQRFPCFFPCIPSVFPPVKKDKEALEKII